MSKPLHDDRGYPQAPDAYTPARIPALTPDQQREAIRQQAAKLARSRRDFAEADNVVRDKQREKEDELQADPEFQDASARKTDAQERVKGEEGELRRLLSEWRELYPNEAATALPGLTGTESRKFVVRDHEALFDWVSKNYPAALTVNTDFIPQLAQQAEADWADFHGDPDAWFAKDRAATRADLLGCFEPQTTYGGKIARDLSDYLADESEDDSADPE